jgi:hypothetical protein
LTFLYSKCYRFERAEPFEFGCRISHIKDIELRIVTAGTSFHIMCVVVAIEAARVYVVAANEGTPIFVGTGSLSMMSHKRRHQNPSQNPNSLEKRGNTASCFFIKYRWMLCKRGL